jgi:hypothetical protein
MSIILDRGKLTPTEWMVSPAKAERVSVFNTGRAKQTAFTERCKVLPGFVWRVGERLGACFESIVIFGD